MKKQIISASAVLLIGILSVGGIALAQSGTTPYSVSAGPNGSVKLSGTILSISNSASSTSWNVASWGGTWTVDVTNAKVVGNGNGSTTISSFANGDSVIVVGTASSSSLAVTATSVAEANTSNAGAGAGNGGVKVGFWGNFFGRLHDIFFGVVSNVNTSANTFTLTGKNGNAVTVDVNASTTVKTGTSTSVMGSIGNLVNGAWALVKGTTTGNASGTITATKVRASAGAAASGTVGIGGMGGGLKGFFGGWFHMGGPKGK